MHREVISIAKNSSRSCFARRKSLLTQGKLPLARRHRCLTLSFALGHEPLTLALGRARLLLPLKYRQLRQLVFVMFSLSCLTLLLQGHFRCRSLNRSFLVRTTRLVRRCELSRNQLLYTPLQPGSTLFFT